MWKEEKGEKIQKESDLSDIHIIWVQLKWSLLYIPPIHAYKT